MPTVDDNGALHNIDTTLCDDGTSRERAMLGLYIVWYISLGGDQYVKRRHSTHSNSKRAMGSGCCWRVGHAKFDIRRALVRGSGRSLEESSDQMFVCELWPVN